MTLSGEEVSRYGRQLILDQVQVKGQEILKSSSVLIVGAGGLGSPVALYLAAAGIGKLGVVDYDAVEISNLHRQIMHKESGVGVMKADSAQNAIKDLNSCCQCETFNIKLSSENALEIIKRFDVVVDASDNVATRYLVNDACVLAGKPLVSGSALRFSGQLVIYNYGRDGPCYRCLFPDPPPPETVTNCSDGGVVGAVCGVIGSLQAAEVMKLLLGQETGLAGHMMLYDGLECSFRKVRLRKRQENCKVCGLNPEITHLIDYEQFCGRKADDKTPSLRLLDPEQRITVMDLKELIDSQPHKLMLIDVRGSIEYDICHIDGAKNLPLKTLESRFPELLCLGERQLIMVCRRGNASQKAVKLLNDLGLQNVKDVIGGLEEWKKVIDPSLPSY